MIDKADRITLLAEPAFQRFMFSMIQASGLFEVTANAGDGRALYLEGRRSLALDLMRELEDAQPVQSQSGAPVLTILQALRDGDPSIQIAAPRVQSAPKEKSVERSAEYRDLSDGDE